eukprot:UN18575
MKEFLAAMDTYIFHELCDVETLMRLHIDISADRLKKFFN